MDRRNAESKEENRTGSDKTGEKRGEEKKKNKSPVTKCHSLKKMLTKFVT